MNITLAPLEVHELNETVVFAGLQPGTDAPPSGALGQADAEDEASTLLGSLGGTVNHHARVVTISRRAPEPEPRPRGLALHERIRDVDVISMTLETLADCEQEPELVAELEATLLQTIHGTREKIDRTAAVLASFESDENLCSLEIQRLIARMERLANQRKRLEAYVIGALSGAELTKFDGHTSTLTVRKNPAALVIEPGAVIPAEYMRTPEPPPPPAPVPDKIRIKAAIKKGAAIAGCRLAQALRLERS